MKLPDLSPQSDVKGGSPKTPNPTTVRQYWEAQDTPPPPYTNGNGFWRSASLVTASLLIGVIGMYFTALRERGITREEMEVYVQKAQDDQERHYPWPSDKPFIIERLAKQDQLIGELRAKIDLNANYIEEQKKR